MSPESLDPRTRQPGNIFDNASQDAWTMEEEKEFVETCAAHFSVIVGGPSKGLSVVGSGAQGHGGDEDDLGKEGFKATERSTSKGGRGVNVSD